MNNDKPVLIIAGHIDHRLLDRVLFENPGAIVVSDFKDVDELKVKLTDITPEPFKIEALPVLDQMAIPYSNNEGNVLSARAQRRKKERDLKKQLKKDKKWKN